MITDVINQRRNALDVDVLTVERAYHFNILGALGWWFNGRVLRRKVLPANQLRAFNLLTPFLKLERWVRPPFGLSLVVVARRPGEPAAERPVEMGAAAPESSSAGVPAS